MHNTVIFWIHIFALFKIVLGNDLYAITTLSKPTIKCLKTPMDVRLYNSSTELAPSANGKNVVFKNIKGLVEILNPHSMFLCFPKKEDHYRKAYILSHVICRQLGFTTFASIEPKELPRTIRRFKTNSYDCTGQEQHISQCKWDNVSTGQCKFITEMSCGACAGYFKGFKGVIKSPGYPFVSLNDVTCEWHIIVPEHHSIYLSVDHFEAMDTENPELPCGVHQPFVEILYGIQSKVTVRRYCQLDDVKNLSIPFNTVTVRIFTGFSYQKREISSDQNLGITITFEAISEEEELYGSPLKMVLLTFMGLAFIACIVFCHYIDKHKFCDCVAKPRVPVDVEKTQEFQLCCEKKAEKQNPGLTVRFDVDELKSEKVYDGAARKNFNDEALKRLEAMFEIPKEFMPNETLNDSAGDAQKKILIRDRQILNYSGEGEMNHRLAVPTICQV